MGRKPKKVVVTPDYIITNVDILRMAESLFKQGEYYKQSTYYKQAAKLFEAVNLPMRAVACRDKAEALEKQEDDRKAKEWIASIQNTQNTTRKKG